MFCDYGVRVSGLNRRPHFGIFATLSYLLLASVQCSFPNSLKEELGSDSRLRFTNGELGYYNVSVDISKNFVHCNMKMGMYVHDHRVEINYFIADSKLNDLFLLYQKKIANFAFFKLTRKAGRYPSVVFPDIIVGARNKKSQELIDTTRIHFNVVLDNSHRPLFTNRSVNVTISEFSAIGDEVARVLATDKDQGLNGQIYYFIPKEQSSVLQEFAIHPETGVISVINFLAGIAPKTFRFDVQARDRCIKENAQFVSQRLSVQITVLSDKSGREGISSEKKLISGTFSHRASIRRPFSQRLYVVNMTELAPPSTSIITLKLELQKGDDRDRCLYGLNGGNEKGHFQINSKTGLIYTNRDLDFETATQHRLSVFGSYGGMFVARTTVLVNVMDANDNSPTFTTHIDDVEVDEDIPVGGLVTTVRATDADSGDNGRVTYALANVNQTAFDVEPNSGKIFVARPLDRDTVTPAVTLLRVRASDRGRPFRRQADTFVRVTVRDINDNPPVLMHSSCTLTVKPGVQSGVTLLEVQALDLDVTLQNTSFMISNPQLSSDFILLDSHTGVISLDGSAQSVLSNSPIKVQIMAADGQHTTAHKLDVSIALAPQSQSRDVDSNCTLSHLYLGVKALQKHRSAFLASVQQDTTIPPRIPVSNRYLPVFARYNPSISLKENNPVGIMFSQIKATDKDLGCYGLVVYSLFAGNEDGNFLIDAVNGSISLSKELDYEQRKSYNLVVRAWDTGNPRRFNQVPIKINVIDVNDNAPEFNQSEFTIVVKENTRQLQALTTIKAYDKDGSENGRVTYSLVSTSTIFSLDATSGDLYLLRPLDREKQTDYTLEIMATDHAALLPKSSNAKVHVVVEDVNDCKPQCYPSMQALHIPRHYPIGSVIGRVMAFDNDSDSRGAVQYRLLASKGNYFVIHSKSGIIQIKEQFLYLDESFNLTVEVSDGGTPSLSSLCHITVLLFHHGVYAVPVFDSVVDYAIVTSIPRSITQGSRILTVAAGLEGDGGIDFDIVDGSGLGKFLISSETGEIRTRQSNFLEKESFFWLTIQARVKQQTSSFRNVHAVVYVKHKELQLPYFNPSVYHSSLLENSPPASTVTQLYVVDPNSYNLPSNLLFDIVSGNEGGHFDVHSNGFLVCMGSLDYESNQEFLLNISASVTGSTTLKTYAIVYISVVDVNDGAILNAEGSASSFVNILALSGSHAVGQLIVYDTDSGDNGRLHFEMTRPDVDLTINSTSGIITSRSGVSGTSMLEVTVSDNGNPKHSVFAFVQVDSYEKPSSPMNLKFTKSVFRFDISEGVQAAVIDLNVVLEDLCSQCDKIFLQVVSGNDRGDFSSFPFNKQLIALRPLDYEQQAVYSLKLQATDGFETAECTLQVVVKDVYEVLPAMTSQPCYETSITEGSLTANTELIQVEAVSKYPLSNTKYRYKIAGGSLQDINKLFYIDEGTGQLRNFNIKTDREIEDTYSVIIAIFAAPEYSGPAVTGAFCVVVKVDDANDNTPTFMKKEYDVSVSDALAPSVPIITLTATDNDIGINAMLEYAIESGNEKAIFYIDGRTGVIGFATSYRSKGTESFKLIVKVSDGGTPVLSSLAVVKITVTPGRQLLAYAKESYNITLLENSPANSIIFHETTISMPETTYTLMPISSDGCLKWFHIDPFCGVVTAMKQLDAEVFRLCSFLIRAESGKGRQSSTKVFVHVEDVNDNSPVFVNASYHGVVMEGFSRGSDIMTDSGTSLNIKAVDKDAGPNGAVDVEILEEDAKRYFTIDPSGVLKTRKVLNREANSMYRFHVKASDKGNVPLVAYAVVMVTVKDVNDRMPEFHSAEYSAVLYLPLHNDTAVTTVKASDSDTGTFANISYKLLSHKTEFMLNAHTGLLSIKNAYTLGREQEVSVSVSATDGIFSAVVSVKVSMRRVPKSNFRFTQSTYTATVTENENITTDLLLLNVVGYDVGDCITFTWLDFDPAFPLDPIHGIIGVRQDAMFDRELIPYYIMHVQASDGHNPPRVAQALVNVTVRDVNDNPPRFLNEPYYASVDIETRKGTPVMWIKATDNDAAQNAVVRYRIVSGASDLFAINAETGVLSTRRDFIKGRTATEYRVTVRATDMGEPPLAQETLVQLPVVNKDTPIFPRAFNVSVAEDSPRGFVVVTATAQGPKQRPVFYCITAGDPMNMFAIDFNTGEVSILHKLDRGLVSSYALTIRALDSRTGSWSETSCHVHVTDVNDHVPLFERASYDVTVREDADIGESLLQVTARDLDVGMNAAITYSLSSNDHFSAQSFSVDSESGVVRIVRKLDYETAASHVITIHAKDQGTLPLESFTFVKITVEDVNDNPPVFQHDRFKFHVEKYSMPNQFVGVITALDADWIDANRLVYGLPSSSELFTIKKKTGMIRMRSRPLSTEHALVLNVSCSDGVSMVYATVEVTFDATSTKTLDDNVEPFSINLQENDSPKFLTVFRSESIIAGYEAGTEFVIDSEVMKQQFAIGRNNSALRSLVSIDREKSGGNFIVPVRCFSPSGRFTLFRLNVTVLDENDNAPVFDFGNYHGVVTKDMAIGATVVRVSATDADYGSNADITYTTDGLDDQSALSVDKNTGEIILMARPQGKLYQFVVKASDNGYPVRESSTLVKVHVLQPTEGVVKFINKNLTLYVSEDVRAGSLLMSASARVQGGVRKEPIEYVLTESLASGGGHFVLGKSNGELKLRRKLNYEAFPMHRVMIEAVPHLEDTLSEFIVVTINVQNANDNPPILDSKLYQISLSEGIKTGVQVLRLSARDKDWTSESNSQLVFAFANATDAAKTAFTLDAKSGWLTTKSSLDREKVPRYSIPFTVTDELRGSKEVLSTSGRIEVDVVDVNDCTPTFSNSVYKFVMREDFLPGQKIGQVFATDDDVNPTIHYSLASSGRFEIDEETGDLRVAARMDAERLTTVVVTAVASDGVHSSLARVEVEIQDTNDNRPICRRAFYNQSVSEATPKGSSLFQIDATDVDQRDELLFLVQGDGIGKFFVDPHTGMLSPSVVLDREKQSQYSFKVVVTDKSGHSCASDVFLEVTDANDNRPVFTQGKYLATVRENVSLSVVFTRVQAVDIDIAADGRVYYSLQSSFDGTFKIGSYTGLVSVEKALSKARVPTYTLHVIARDGGSPPLSSSVALTVVVLSKDDRPPRFSRASYSFNVSESALIGDEVGSVAASPSDANKAEDIRYVIVIGDDVCTLDRHSGVLKLRRRLDYERTKSTTVSVKAEYSFAPALASIVTVVIHVDDVNDNAPLFGQASITRVIDENLRPNSFVLQALATDNDTGDNGRLTYKILATNDEALPFTIKPGTGAIHVSATGTIDREERSSYLFQVEAADHGEPSRKSTVQINITVADLNDNAPTISILNTTVILQQSSVVGTTVVTLSASDADTALNGAPFHFLLTKGSSSAFALERTNDVSCRLVTKQLLGAAGNGPTPLTIRVRDNGSPPQFTNSHVNVVVVPDSSFAPELTEPTTFFALLQHGMRSLTVGTLKVRDKDPSDYHTFSIVSGNEQGYFTVDQITGVIRGNVLPGLFPLGIQVTDGRFNDARVINVVIHNETTTMYDNSVVISVSNMKPDDFISNRMSTLAAFLSRVTGTGLQNVNIWSVQSRGRQRRSTDKKTVITEVAFAVRKQEHAEVYVTPSAMRKLMIDHFGDLEASTGGSVAIPNPDVCASSPCPADEQCASVVRLIDDSPTKTPSIQSREFHVTYKCLCLEGSKDPSCPLFNPCDNNPCPVGEVCIRDGNSYQCRCQDDKLCNRDDEAITLDGSGNMRYELHDSFDKMFKTFSIEFRTEEKTGTLFYAYENDYCILELVSGRLQFRFDLGSGPGLVSINELQVNDGDWHIVEVQRSGNYVALSLDSGKYRSSGKAEGNLVKFDLLSNTFFIGTSVVSASDSTARTKRSSRNTYNAFKGCLRRPKLNGDSLPWSGSDSVIKTAQSFSVKFKCKDSGMCGHITCPYFSQCINTLTSYRCQCLPGHKPPYCRPLITCKDAPCLHGGTCTYSMIDNTIQYRCHCPPSYTGPQCRSKTTACSNNPCQNGGTCRETGSSYVCACNRRFKGRHCEQDTDPCRSRPCFRNAECTNLGLNRFSCNCDQETLGARCGFGEYCASHICENRGSCVETLKGATCNCASGFTGERCEKDINECLRHDICDSDNTCINTLGGYFCNCTQSGSCAVAGGTLSSSGPSLVVIVGAVAGLLILLIVAVVLVCCYRKRQRRKRFEQRTAGEQPEVKYPFNCYSLNQYQGVPETPPPQASPRRPPSYYDSDYAMAETDFYDPSAIGGSTVSSKSDCVKSPFSESACSDKERVEVDEDEELADCEARMYEAKACGGAESTAADGRSLSSEYHWDYAEVPEDVRIQSNRKMSREGSYMAIPLTEAPNVPARTASRRSSMRGNEDVPPTPPDYPRNICISRQSLPQSENASPTAARHREARPRGMSASTAQDDVDACPSEMSLARSYAGVNMDLSQGDFKNRYSLTTEGSKNSVFQPIDDDEDGAGPSRQYYEPEESELHLGQDGFSETTYNSDEEDYAENDPLDPDDTRKLVREIKVLFKDIQSRTEEDM